MSLLEVSDLRKNYNGTPAVQGLSFSLEAGEVLGLLGPNGSGKSTTMMMLAGLLKPDSGGVRIEGRPFRFEDRDMRRLLGVVPQELALYPDLTPGENLNFFGRLYGLRGAQLKERIDSILEQTGLTRNVDDFAGTFSGGMKRRLNFGIALLAAPRILILDEPTVGVDPQSRAHLLDAVRRLRAQGVGILYASHYMEEVEAICDRVLIIDHGCLLAAGTVPELLSTLQSDVCLGVTPRPGLAERLAGLATVETRADGTAVVVVPLHEHDGTPSLNDRLLPILNRLNHAGAVVRSIETREANLERLFLELTGRKLRD
jgi:ABC-2 type transport system ATP-binding protein